jgi:hypothetical protein
VKKIIFLDIGKYLVAYTTWNKNFR